MTKSRSRKSKALVPEPQPPTLAMLGEETSLATLQNQPGFFSRAWEWLQARPSGRSDSPRLRVADTVSLGDKRFVAVVQVGGRDFLIAGGPTNIALLAQLDPKEPFGNVLHRTMVIPGISEKPKRKVKKKAKAKSAAKPETIDAGEQQPAMASPEFNDPCPQPAKGVKPARKSVTKPKSEAGEMENAPVIPPFTLPESFRYALKNTEASTVGKPVNQQNGRGEAEHVGHWA